MAGMSRHVSAATIVVLEHDLKSAEAQIQRDLNRAVELEHELVEIRRRVESAQAFKADLQLLIQIAPRKV